MDEPIKPKVSVIIINYNGLQFLQNCLNSIINNTAYPNYEVIVVDNCSVDDSVAFLEKNYPNIKLIKNNVNLGFAKANNQAICSTKGDYLFLLNNDTEVIGDFISTSVALAQSDPIVGIVGSKVIYMNGTPQYMGDRIIPRSGLLSKLLIKYEMKGDYVKETDFILGAAFLVKREVFNRVGFFDEGFFIWGEEGDFCCRTRAAGFKILYNPESKIKHHSGGSLIGDTHYFYSKRNAVRFYLLNFTTFRLLIQAFFEVPVIFGAILNRRLPLLIKAYRENLMDIEEIRRKRKTRKLYCRRRLIHRRFIKKG